MYYLKHKKHKIISIGVLSLVFSAILGFNTIFSSTAFADTKCDPSQLQTQTEGGGGNITITCSPCPAGQTVTENVTDSDGNTANEAICCQTGSTPTTDAITNKPTCSTALNTDQTPASYGCGAKPTVLTSIDFGCKGDACVSGSTSGYCSSYHNPIIDALFSIIQFLSAGVGILVVASVIVGGIQFTLARDNPEAANKARARIQTALIALLIYIFAYAILNYLIPIGFFNQ